MIRSVLLLLALLAACSHVAPAPEVLPEPPIPVVEPSPPPPAVTVPRKIRAALDRAVPREQALAASPASNGADIALVILLHRNVVSALAELERDGGRHVTPAAIARAQTAVKDLQNHLNEFQASSAPPQQASQPESAAP
jgi:hypothetical protein